MSSENAVVELELGKALVLCQLFENSLLMLLSLLSEHKLPSEGAAFLLVWDFVSKKPLGQLFQYLKNDLELPQDFQQYLQDGIDLRNELVHRFIRENIGLLANESGRREAVVKIKTIAREVRKRDRAVGKLIDVLLTKYGLSQATLKELSGRLYN